MNIKPLIVLIIVLFLPQPINTIAVQDIDSLNDIPPVSDHEFSCEMLSLNEMVAIRGGCGGGGTCGDYTPTCKSGCTVVTVKKCSGSNGDCVQDLIVVSCRCDYATYYTSGCR